MTNQKDDMFTPKQKDVITASVDNILVSAAAGSGKTTVLVERIIRKIVSHDISISEILVVTFTKAAASNMQKKIEEALREAIVNNQGDIKYLKEQLDLLPSAYIQTIDSFCSRVLKEKGYELIGKESSIEPNMTVLSGQDVEVFIHNSAQDAINDKYLTMITDGTDDAFLKAVDYLTDGRRDDKLAELLVFIYKKLRSLPDYLTLIDEAYAKRVAIDEKNELSFLKDFNEKYINLFIAAKESAQLSLPLVDSVLFKAVKDKKSEAENNAIIASAKNVFSTVISEVDNVLNVNASTDDQTVVFNKIKEAINNISGLVAFSIEGRDSSVDNIREAFGGVSALLLEAGVKNEKGGTPRRYGRYASPYSIDEKYRVFITKDIDELLNAQKERTIVIGALIELLKKVDYFYSKTKKRYHSMDFADQEHYALLALSSEEVASFYRDRFKEIYVDEYQDNSTLQDAIIQKFSNKNVFMVGDVKQSIYKFRYANPNMFIRKMKEYGKKNGSGTLYDLNNNFRSTPEILAFVNALFYQLMSDATEIDYNSDHELYPKPKKEGEAEVKHSLPRVVLVTNEAAEDDSEANDDADTSDINSAVKVEFTGILNEVNKYKQSYSLKDICILTIKKDAARGIARLLENNGIPAVCPEEKTIYGDPDIASICALITLLGNEHRDECLLGVMLAGFKFSNFTVEEIAKISLFAKKNEVLHMNLIVKVRMYANQSEDSVSEEDKELYLRTQNFVKEFDALRTRAAILNIGELIEEIYAVSGIKANMLARDNDVSKLVVFKNWLCEKFLSKGSDIASVSNSLEELKLKLGDKASFEFESQNVDAVQCMTYHKSKGLEFKCVIVTNINSSSSNNPSLVVFDEENGFICDDYSDDNVSRETSFEHLLYGDKVKLADYSEIIRLFYVALTRAEENLSIVTSFALTAKPRDKFDPIYRMIINQREEKFTKDFILNQQDKNSLFINSLLRLSGANSFFQNYVKHYAEADSPLETTMFRSAFDGFELEVMNYDAASAGSSSAKVIVTPEEENYLVHQDENGDVVFDKDYEHQSSVGAPSKATVTELKKVSKSGKKKNETVKSMGLEIPDLDKFFIEQDNLSSANKGTTVHELFRFMDFDSILKKLDADMDPQTVYDEEISVLEKEGVIDKSTVEVIDEFRENVISFIKSDLFRRIAVAETKGMAEFERPIMFASSLKLDEDGSDVKYLDDYTIVQGIIDALFYEDGEAIIVDYKTDKPQSDDVEKIKEAAINNHKLQLDLYAAALETSGIKVKSKIIWLVRSGLAIEV